MSTTPSVGVPAPRTIENDYEVVIIGAGVAGAAAAYHLSLLPNLGPNSVCVYECGDVGRGDSKGKPLLPHAQITNDDLQDVKTEEGDVAGSGVFTFARSSGTAVWEDASDATIKMIVNVFPCSADTYISHFGQDGARSYLRLAHKGLELEKHLANTVMEDASVSLTCEGSLYVCLHEDIVAFEREYSILHSLGAKDIELWDEEKTQATAGNGFARGIYFPHDAAIDSSNYSIGLLRYAVASGKVILHSNSSLVIGVDTITSPHTCALTRFKNGNKVYSNMAVLSTGGLFMDPHLCGILTPMWSYLVSIPEPPLPTQTDAKTDSKTDSKKSPFFRLQSPNSMNFFSWQFTHDWCLTKGNLRMSGEDHYSALKPPKSKERCQRMVDWTVGKLPYLQENAHNYRERYGVYSETPDCSPLVGTAHPNSRICYLLGCNAWGQAVLSFASSLIPALLGYTTMNSEDAEDFKVMNIRRFIFLDAVMEGTESTVAIEP